MQTIKSSEEISLLFSKGKRYSNRYITLIVDRLDNHTTSQHDLNGRVAFIAGKRWGNAVWRNSAKRRLREIYRTFQDELYGYDVLFIAKSNVLSDSYSKVLNTCGHTIDKIDG